MKKIGMENAIWLCLKLLNSSKRIFMPHSTITKGQNLMECALPQYFCCSSSVAKSVLEQRYVSVNIIVDSEYSCKR